MADDRRPSSSPAPKGARCAVPGCASEATRTFHFRGLPESFGPVLSRPWSANLCDDAERHAELAAGRWWGRR